MTAIPAVSRKVATMADGTLRLTVDIEPMHANEAFALFGAGNVPMALAALNVGAQIPDEPKEAEPELKGGVLARAAGMLVNNAEFHQYLLCMYGAVEKTGSEGADQAIKTLCGIASKKELDHKPFAAKRFHDLVRKPFLEWQENGLPPI